jgi:ornithine cyclodeaminase/alanine dehydrogenase-like protein (mu-crystallin family)
MTVLLDNDQVRSIAKVDEVVDCIRAAFTRDFSTTLRMPFRSSLALEDGGILLIMPAYDSALGVAGVKTVSVTKTAGVTATYELIDPVQGSVLLHAQANWLTDLRTAATSALATSLMARPEAHVLGIFGTGRQAESHIAVLKRVRRITRVLVCGSPKSDPRPFCHRMSQLYSLEVKPVDGETCVRQADIICTCTSSGEPLFDGQWLTPGTHLNLIGAFQPTTREVDDETVVRARVVVDIYDGALAEAGDLLIPLGKGLIRRDHVIADLHEIASGKRQARTSAEDITLFKSVGCALEDLVTAKLIYDRATA